MWPHFIVGIAIVGNIAQGHVPVKQPSFTTSPMTLRLTENDVIFLPCVIDNLGESHVRWWKGRTLLSDSSIATMLTPPKITVSNDGMTIGSAEPEDAGEYTCEIVRPKPWSSLKQTHKVIVQYRPKITIIPREKFLEVAQGEIVKLGCFTEAEPPATIAWRTREYVYPPKKGEHIIEFVASGYDKSGLYQCEADNGIGKPVYGNFILKVLQKPRVTAKKAQINSAPGAATDLVCQVTAYPEPQVQWFFNEKLLNLSQARVEYQIRGDDHLLRFAFVRLTDFGNYTCRAANRLGESEVVIELTGVAYPAIIKKAEGTSSEEFTLIWEVESIEHLIEYKLLFRKAGDDRWSSFIIPAEGTSSSIHSKSYTFTGLDKLAAYEAKILSRNRYGWSPPSEVTTFGFIKEDSGGTPEAEDEDFGGVSESTSSASKLSMAIPAVPVIVALRTFKFFQYIYDIS